MNRRSFLANVASGTAAVSAELPSAHAASNAAAGKSVLMIATSQARAVQSGKPTGLWMSELADPYWSFKEAGVVVTVASVRGGAPPIDPRSMEGERGQGPDVQRFMADRRAMAEFTDAPSLRDIMDRAFDAVFLVGGHGTVWDFPHNLLLIRCIERLYDTGRFIVAVCHGPSGLLNVKTANGDWLLQGRSVTAFSNEEEQRVGLTEEVPFLLETAIVKRGGHFSAAASFKPHVVQDGQLITGQNPASARPAAERLLAAWADQ